MTLPAISLHQPWASLCVTRRPDGQVVKRYETRSWRPPAGLVEQRIAIHATKRLDHGALFDMEDALHRDLGVCFVDFAPPLGVIVGSAVLGEPLPMYEFVVPVAAVGPEGRTEWCDHDDSHVCIESWPGERAVTAWPDDAIDPDPLDLTDQDDYGDFSPGRWAWPLLDAAPTTERCPWCCGEGDVLDGSEYDGHYVTCPVCHGAGSCDPIPAKGRQGFWRWEP